MILAIDVHYRSTIAKAVGIEFADWGINTIANTIVSYISDVGEYIPGEFYKRELPSIWEILNKTKLDLIKYIVVDGYVYLDDFEKPGLGMHLYNSMDPKIPVIGVAKTSFLQNKTKAREVFRGESKNPLYVSSVGVSLEKAGEFIQTMHGEYRIPALLKLLDTFTKEE